MRVLVSLIVVWGLWAGVAAADTPARQITVSGLGEAAAAPDMAQIRLGVAREARRADQALSETSAAMRAIMAALSEAGVAPEEMQTTGLSLSPRYHHSSNQAPEVVGYVAQNMLTVRVTALEKLGAILDATSDAGANQIQGLSFGIAAPQPLRDAARRAAVADARARAALYAEAAGVTLGPLLSLREEGAGGGPRPMAMEMARMASDAVPVAEGELTLSARVTMVFAIAE